MIVESFAAIPALGISLGLDSPHPSVLGIPWDPVVRTGAPETQQKETKSQCGFLFQLRTTPLLLSPSLGQFAKDFSGHPFLSTALWKGIPF